MADAGFGSYFLSGVNRGLEQAGKDVAGRVVSSCGRISIGDLPQDLRFTEDDRFEPGSNTEKMLDGLFIQKAIDIFLEFFLGYAMCFREKGFQLVETRLICNGINLNPVARRENDDFAQCRKIAAAATAETSQRGVETMRGESQVFAYVQV